MEPLPGRAPGPLVADITDVGTLVPMVADAKPTKGRYVWGIAGVPVTTIRVAAGPSSPQSQVINRVIPGVRAFYAQVPATGSVTVTAADANGTVIATRTFN
jgi:hypothetical protein